VQRRQLALVKNADDEHVATKLAIVDDVAAAMQTPDRAPTTRPSGRKSGIRMFTEVRKRSLKHVQVIIRLPDPELADSVRCKTQKISSGKDGELVLSHVSDVWEVPAPVGRTPPRHL